MKRCLVLLVIMEMQVKTSTRYHFILLNTTNIKQIDYTKCHSFLGKMKNDTSTLKNSSALSDSIKHISTL